MNTKKIIFGLIAVTLVLAMVFAGTAAAARETYFIADDGSGEGTGSPENPLNAEQFFASVFNGTVTADSTTGITVPAGKIVTLPSVMKLASATGIADETVLKTHFISYTDALQHAEWTNSGTVYVAKEDASYPFRQGWHEPEYQLILAAGPIGGNLELYADADLSSLTQENADACRITKTLSLTGKGNPSVTLSGQSGYEQITLGNTDTAGFAVAAANVTFLTTSTKNGCTIQGNYSALLLESVSVAPASAAAPVYADEVIKVTGYATVSLLNCSPVDAGMNIVELHAPGTVVLKNTDIRLHTADGAVAEGAAAVVQAAETDALHNCKIYLGENCSFELEKPVKTGAWYASLKDGALSGTDTNEVIVTTADAFAAALGNPKPEYYDGGVWTGNLVVADDISLTDDYDGREPTKCSRTIVINTGCTLDLNGHAFYDRYITVNGDVVTKEGAASAGGKLLAETLTVSEGSTVEEFLDSASGKSAGTVFDLLYISIKGGTCAGSIIIVNDLAENGRVVIPAGLTLSFDGKDISVGIPENGTFSVQMLGDELKAGYTLTADGPATGKMVLARNTKKKTDGPDYTVNGTLYLQVPLECATDSAGTASVLVGNGGKIAVSEEGKITLNSGSLTIGETTQAAGGSVAYTGSATLDGDVTVANGSLYVTGGTLNLNPDYTYILGSGGTASLHVADADGNGGKILGYATIHADSSASLFFDYDCIGDTVFIEQEAAVSAGTEESRQDKSRPTAAPKDKTGTVTRETTETAKSPFPVLGILAGLGIAGVLMTRRP